MKCTCNVPNNVCVFCKFICYLVKEFLVCTYSLSSPLRLSAAGWWVDRIPIATKGGKTAAGKDQIIHYTQQQRGKRQKYNIKRKRQRPENTQHTTTGRKRQKTKRQRPDDTQQQGGKRQKYDKKIKKAKTRKHTTHNNREKKTKYKKAKAR